MYIWINGESLMKRHCLKKKKLYNKVNMKNIIDPDYMHAKRACKDFETKK